MPATKAQQKAVSKYMKENYDKPMPENSKEVFRYFFEITKKKKINLMIEGVGRNWVISKINE